MAPNNVDKIEKSSLQNQSNPVCCNGIDTTLISLKQRKKDKDTDDKNDRLDEDPGIEEVHESTYKANAQTIKDDNKNYKSCVNNEMKDFKVYHKQKEHALNKNVSIRSALLDVSPKWLKSFLKEPEHMIMTKAKKGDE